jgi:hypothetical protein
MHISRHIYDSAISAERGRQQVARTGFMCSNRVWRLEEDRVLFEHYPDYSALRKALPNRTYNAIRWRVAKLGIQKRHHIWTGGDVVRLRKLYPSASKRELLAAFPGQTLDSLTSFARRRHMSRKRPVCQVTGRPLLDAIRSRCAELGYSMHDLDKMARTKRYFQASRWQQTKSEKNAAIFKAVRVLEGTLSVIWSKISDD